MEPESAVAARGSAGVWVRRLAPWALAALILGILFARIPLRQVVDAVEQASLARLMALSAAAVAAILAADSLALWLAFRASLPGTPLRLGEVAGMRGASYILAALSWGVGQGGLVWLLRRRHGVSIAAGAGAVFLASGALLIVLAGAVGAGLATHEVPERPELQWTAWVLLAGVPVYLAVIALRPRPLAGLALFRPLFDAGVGGTALVTAARGLHLLIMIGGHFLALRLFAIDVPVAAALARVPVVLLVSALPIAPSGLGTGQAAAVALFADYAPGATDDERAAAVLAYSLSYHVIATVLVCAIGVVCLRRETRGVKFGGGLGGRINWVTIVLALAAGIAIYLGVVLLPVWWQARKVDSALDGYQQEVAQLRPGEDEARALKVLDDLWDDIGELGIGEDQGLELYFSPDYSSLHAEYRIEVHFFFGVHRTFHFHRSKTFTE